MRILRLSALRLRTRMPAVGRTLKSTTGNSLRRAATGVSRFAPRSPADYHLPLGWQCLYLGLLGDLERVIDFDAKVAACRLDLRVPEQQLHRTEVFRATVDQGCL